MSRYVSGSNRSPPGTLPKASNTNDPYVSGQAISFGIAPEAVQQSPEIVSTRQSMAPSGRAPPSVTASRTPSARPASATSGRQASHASQMYAPVAEPVAAGGKKVVEVRACVPDATRQPEPIVYALVRSPSLQAQFIVDVNGSMLGWLGAIKSESTNMLDGMRESYKKLYAEQMGLSFKVRVGFCAYSSVDRGIDARKIGKDIVEAIYARHGQQNTWDQPGTKAAYANLRTVLKQELASVQASLASEKLVYHFAGPQAFEGDGLVDLESVLQQLAGHGVHYNLIFLNDPRGAGAPAQRLKQAFDAAGHGGNKFTITTIDVGLALGTVASMSQAASIALRDVATKSAARSARITLSRLTGVNAPSSRPASKQQYGSIAPTGSRAPPAASGGVVGSVTRSRPPSAASAGAQARSPR